MKEQHRGHGDDADGAAEIEELVMLVQNGLHMEQGEVSGDQEEAKLGRAKTPKGHAEFVQRVSREIGLDREQEEENEQGGGYQRAHVSGEREAYHERDGTDAVENVVHVKTVAGTLLLADAGEGAIQAVAKPVEGKEADGGD